MTVIDRLRQLRAVGLRDELDVEDAFRRIEGYAPDRAVIRALLTRLAADEREVAR